MDWWWWIGGGGLVGVDWWGFGGRWMKGDWWREDRWGWWKVERKRQRGSERRGGVDGEVQLASKSGRTAGGESAYGEACEMFPEEVADLINDLVD